ncbi:MAG: hypothetical protein EA382_14885 [Spirochaetaceae bacterium]|nr:MAG: hypothetical protein EA382_14885 [Spirochaetaceae bacterium]
MRRWWSDTEMDLIVWFDGTTPREFQLCFDKSGDQRALVWGESGRLSLMRVDDGEGRPGTYKASAVLSESGEADIDAVADRFRDNSVRVDPVVRNHVLGVLSDAVARRSD